MLTVGTELMVGRDLRSLVGYGLNPFGFLCKAGQGYQQARQYQK